MEGFSMLLNNCIEEAGNFWYHQGCEELKITYLCFTNDLFVFTGGDLASVEVLKIALERFHAVSGLEPNISKSQVSLVVFYLKTRAVILNSLQFQPGTFPIKYLGVHLSSICLRVVDFAPLVNQLKLRIRYWKSKFLSFGGRKELVISVLQSMQLYWIMILTCIVPTTGNSEAI
ncbi:hypothetical protein OSB04_028361 [Centaurea solstitialis]|uniref:Reverse transcriptase domain-containing protein n=1 Tax=Centaurea solstitialis TaxID=347529 RepID=A0AA38ST22_9ASTR|nr:hypothetical protein OSB04_028361 [Centaurea solstitialis]